MRFHRLFASGLVLLAVVAFLALPQRSQAQETDLALVGWMAGCWVAESQGQKTEEHWMAPGGGLMTMMSRTLRGGVARAHEFALIRGGDDGLVFWAYPSGQSPAEFRAATATAEEVSFVNAEHDFPRKIRYRKSGAGRMLASVFSDVDGEEPAFELAFERAACPPAG
jgi:hypothetical protein